jgi:hypothetical protein
MTKSWPISTNHQLTDRATRFGTAQGEQVGVIMARTMAVAAAAIPTLLLLAGAVVIAICMPLLTTTRQRAARDAIAALTRLAEVIRPDHSSSGRWWGHAPTMLSCVASRLWCAWLMALTRSPAHDACSMLS